MPRPKADQWGHIVSVVERVNSQHMVRWFDDMVGINTGSEQGLISWLSGYIDVAGNNDIVS